VSTRPPRGLSRRSYALILLALVVATGCVRLGFWQLHRLSARKALNATLASRLSAPAVDIRDLLRDTSLAQYRRSRASGTYDFDHEFSLAARTREGSPGANIITPLKVAGSDTAVLVNRGWVYAPDAMTVDFNRWRETNDASPTGYLLEIPRGGRGSLSPPSADRVVRRLDYDSLVKRLPYPVAPLMLVQTEGQRPSTPRTSPDSTPARLTTPLMDEGPHLGYAIQWFSFAVIALVGATIGVRTDRRGSYHATGRTRTVIQTTETRHG